MTAVAHQSNPHHHNMAEKFCLKWNDFHSNVSQSFGLFRNEEYLHDVTLVSDDHHQVSAHKLVLSACSEYFKNIFKLNNKPNTHPLLCLDGIMLDDLKNIMDYIYNGEVQIFQDNLDRFLSIAQKLKLEGLMGTDDPEPKEEQSYSVPENVNANTEVTETKQIEKTKAHPRQKSREIVAMDKIVAPISTENIDEIRKTLQQYIETGADGNLKCTICGKEASCPPSAPRVGRRNLEFHIETHLEGLSFPCQLCGKTLRSRESLRKHLRGIHK